MATNNAKSNQFGVVIEPLKENANPEQELANLQSKLLKLNQYFVATIIHNKDRTENNQLKRTHAHAYIETTEKYTQKQFLELLSTCLEIDTIRISVNLDNNGYLLVQYLTHKNDQNKTQYNFDEILTNNEELLTYKYNLKYVNKNLTKQNIEFDLMTCRTLTEFIDKQGLETANRFRTTFNQVKQEQKLDFETLKQENYKLGEFVELIKNYIAKYDFISEQDQVLLSYIKNLLKKYDF